MKNLLLSLAMLFCLSANSQNHYRIQSKLGLDILGQSSETDYVTKSVRVTNMTIETVVSTKWKNGADSRSSDENKLLCLEGYVTKFDFNIKTGFYTIELSSKTGATIKCYIPTYDIEKVLDDENIDIEDARVIFDMENNYNAILNNDYKNCKDALLDFAMWNNLNIGTKYKISEKNKVRIYGFLLLTSTNKAEIQPIIKFTWNQPTVEEMKKRDGI